MAATPTPLEVRNIKKRFGDTEVLKGLSLEAQKGDVITLIGASGSGKSTFLRCMNLLEQPDDGELYVHGEQIRFKTTKHGREPADWKQVVQMRAKLSMVFQSFNLWAHMTLLENIIDPSAMIRSQYIMYNAVTIDGRILSGLLADSNDNTVTLIDKQNNRIVINRSDLDELEESKISLMPEKILEPLTDEELRDLFAYIQAN